MLVYILHEPSAKVIDFYIRNRIQTKKYFVCILLQKMKSKILLDLFHTRTVFQSNEAVDQLSDNKIGRFIVLNGS